MDHDSIVHLPLGYPEDARRYALLYPRDGRNLFDPATAYGGQAWRADETASMLMEELNPFIDSETVFCRMRGTPASVILGWADWSH